MGRTTTAAAESLAKTERSSSPHQGFYLWSFPGAPLQARLSLEVIAQISGALERGPVCGLLLGAASGGATEIADFEPLPDSPGPARSEAISRAFRALGPNRIVGFYRSHADDVLRLNPEDYALADAWFREPHCVFLLIHPIAGEPAAATFFFRDERGMNGDFPFLEFPFDAGRLATQVAPPQRQAPEASAHAPIPQSRDRAAVDTVPAPALRPNRALRRVGMAAATVVLIGGAAYGGFRLLPGYLEKRPVPQNTTAAPPALPPALGLRAERQNGDLKLTWSRESPAIAAANSGVLTILDGDSRRELALNASQVRGGSLLYSPTADQIQMQLAVNGAGGDSVESVIVILPKNGAPVAFRPLDRPGQRPLTPASEERPSDFRATATRQFVPPAPQARPSTAALSPDTPPAASLPAPAAAAPATFLNGQMRQPPRPVPATPEPQPAPAPEKAAVPPPFKPAVIIREVGPTLSQTLRSMILTPRMAEVRVSIDETGKVTRAEGIRQAGLPMIFLVAAENAARQCRFRPALLRDKPVASELVLRFPFKPAQ